MMWIRKWSRLVASRSYNRQCCPFSCRLVTSVHNQCVHFSALPEHPDFDSAHVGDDILVSMVFLTDLQSRHPGV
jgi:hypothetical protein